MSESNKGSDGGDLAMLIRLFGPPPILPNEKLEHFEEMMNRFFACMRPKDFVVSVSVYQAGIETWCMMRWKRYQALMISRWERAARSLGAQQAKLKQQRIGHQTILPELFKDAKTESERTSDLAPSIERVLDDCMTAIGNAEEVDLVVAFERHIDTLQKVELFISQAQKRRDDAFRQVEWYRTSLAQALRKEADVIIDGECTQIATAADEMPLVPGNEHSS